MSCLGIFQKSSNSCYWPQVFDKAIFRNTYRMLAGCSLLFGLALVYTSSALRLRAVHVPTINIAGICTRAYHKYRRYPYTCLQLISLILYTYLYHKYRVQSALRLLGIDSVCGILFSNVLKGLFTNISTCKVFLFIILRLME